MQRAERGPLLLGDHVQEGAINEDEFRVPDFCPEQPEGGLAARLRAKRTGGLARMRALLPNAHYGAHPPDGSLDSAHGPTQPYASVLRA